MSAIWLSVPIIAGLFVWLLKTVEDCERLERENSRPHPRIGRLGEKSRE